MTIVSDFETTTQIPSRVWAWKFCDLLKRNERRGTSIKSFIDEIRNGKYDIIYFHNLKFDGRFILDFLIKSGFKDNTGGKKNISKSFKTIITADGLWYKIEIFFNTNNRVTILDSLKLLPLSVEELGVTFDTDDKKGEIDYEKERPEGYEPSDEEWSYIGKDIYIVADALQALFTGTNLTSDKMTIGSVALCDYKNTQPDFDTLFPQLPREIDAFLRKAYKGGYCYLNPKYIGKVVESGVVYDENSAHPAAMKECMMPYGMPKIFYGEPPEGVLWVAEIYVSKATLKSDFLPTIQVKNNWKYCTAEYAESIEEDFIYVTNVDFELILKHYDIEYEITYGYWFESKIGMFDKYINKWMEVKEKSTGAKRMVAKFMLNNLYGKFGTKEMHSEARVELVNNKLKSVNQPPRRGKTIYVPIALFTTAYSRNNIIKEAQKEYSRFIYCDTDSLHLEGEEVPNINIHPTKLGYYKLESKFEKGKFLKAKTYAEVIDGETSVKCAGLNNKAAKNISFEEFDYEKEYKGNFKAKVVEGGVILEDVGFKIKK